MDRSTRNRLLLIVAIIIVVVLIVGLVVVVTRPKATPGASATPGTSVNPSLVASPSPGVIGPAASPRTHFLALDPTLLASAKADISNIQIRDSAPFTGYARTQFGAAWTDDCSAPTGCHNGCDTRDDILARDLVDITLATKGCTVLSGTLYDPYTAKTIVFKRGVGTSTVVQIDHIVPLGDAWRTGAQDLTITLRTSLANDPLNLVAVDGPTNGAKSDDDAATWLPPQVDSRCAYVVHQVEVKVRYHLWMTAPEQAAIAAVLQGC